MKDKLSIIIPIYNSEKYLRECLDSIVNQTYQNLEIILIDDGSKDDSYSICKEYRKKDKRIKYIYQENSGVSQARNKGIKWATGKYLTFVDSDDFVDLDTYETVLKEMKNTDLVGFGYYTLYQNKIKNQNIKGIETINKSDCINCLFKTNSYRGFCCNKIYDTDLIKKNKLQFDKNLFLYEDLKFNIEYLSYCKKIKYIKNPKYYYRVTQNSATQIKNLRYLNHSIESINQIEKMLYFKSNEFYEFKHRQLMELYLSNPMNKKEIREQIKETYRKIKKTKKIIFFHYFPKTYFWLRKCKYKFDEPFK